MLPGHKLTILKELTANATREELIWISGFLAALTGDLSAVTKQEPAPAIATAAPIAAKKITIAYGTETGNAKKVANEFAAKAKKAGLLAKLVSLDQYRLNDLAKEEYFFTVISTQGDGEPPAAAQKFYEHIHNNGFRLDNLKHGVLALGDSSYPLFCKAGEDVDRQLEKLGSNRLVPLQKCDTDYETETQQWVDAILHSLNQTATVIAPPVVAKKTAGKKTYTGVIAANTNLNDEGSNKATHHIEIITEEETGYEPGDALGVIPYNEVAVVNSIIGLTNIDATKTVTWKGEAFTIRELLYKKLQVVHLPERVIEKYAAITGKQVPLRRIDLADALRIYPVKNVFQFEEVLQILEPIAPRLYSIASSPNAHSGEVHLTVVKNTFATGNGTGQGLASSYLSGLPLNTTIEFYIHRNSLFRLPEADKDIIMIGPGTGIAPFRSFLAERDATGATGKNWLFFGEQHFITDFLYQTEIQNWYQGGVLNKVSLAFSRDQKEKIYVQHRMEEEAADLYNWLQQGAYLYICGTKDPMSIDVENTLLYIMQQQGGLSIEEADEYLLQLKDEGRYIKDVY